MVDTERSSRRARAALPPETRVLVVDDNAANREIVRAYLRGRVAVCDEADGGAQALALLESAAGAGRPYELALLDSDMPELSGADVAHAIRDAPALRSCRLVMLTSAGATEPAPGIERTLTKPVRRSALLDTLAEVLSDAAPAAAAEPVRKVARRSGRVLVAEDNPVNQLVIESLLRQRGVEVDLVADGAQALARLDPELHHAIFMDCQMPNLDGYEATARIRAEEPPGRHMPIIAMTAHAFAGDRERCLRAGMDDYLGKPIRSEALDRTLERWLPAAAADAPESDLIDDERIRSLREVSSTLAENVVEAFIRTTPPLLDSLREAVARGDSEAGRKLAHKLRGGSDTIGAVRLSEIARRVEEGAADAADELGPAYASTLDELDRLGVGPARA